MILHGSVPFRLYKVLPSQLPREAVSEKKNISPFLSPCLAYPLLPESSVQLSSRNSFGSRIYLVRRDTEGLNPHPANLVGSQGSPSVSLPVWFPLHSTLPFSLLLFLLLFLLFLSAFFTPTSTRSLSRPTPNLCRRSAFLPIPIFKQRGKKKYGSKKNPQ